MPARVLSDLTEGISRPPVSSSLSLPLDLSSSSSSSCFALASFCSFFCFFFSLACSATSRARFPTSGEFYSRCFGSTQPLLPVPASVLDFWLGSPPAPFFFFSPVFFAIPISAVPLQTFYKASLLYNRQFHLLPYSDQHMMLLANNFTCTLLTAQNCITTTAATVMLKKRTHAQEE